MRVQSVFLLPMAVIMNSESEDTSPPSSPLTVDDRGTPPQSQQQSGVVGVVAKMPVNMAPLPLAALAHVTQGHHVSAVSKAPASLAFSIANILSKSQDDEHHHHQLKRDTGK